MKFLLVKIALGVEGIQKVLEGRVVWKRRRPAVRVVPCDEYGCL